MEAGTPELNCAPPLVGLDCRPFRRRTYLGLPGFILTLLGDKHPRIGLSNRRAATVVSQNRDTRPAKTHIPAADARRIQAELEHDQRDELLRRDHDIVGRRVGNGQGAEHSYPNSSQV